MNAARGRRLEVFGREGTLNVPSGWISPSLDHLDAAQRWVDNLSDARGHLADVVAGVTPNALGPEVARHALEIMLKAGEASATGRTLVLETTFAV